MRGDGDTSVCISAAEPQLEKRERGRGKKGGEASARKVGEPTYRGGKEGEKRSEARETRLPGEGGGGEGVVAAKGWRRGRTTPATARLNANSFIDWISKSPSFDSCSTFSRASHNPHSHLRHISTLFTPADRAGRERERRTPTRPLTLSPAHLPLSLSPLASLFTTRHSFFLARFPPFALFLLLFGRRYR